MQSILATATTRNGTPVTVRRIQAPDEPWAGRILPFLAHKSGIWQWQLRKLLGDGADELTWRSYLADVAPADADEPHIVAHICTIESADIGLFGHVYTDPQWRGQSIARILTKATMDDFAARGGQAMWLVTEFDSTPYRVYQQFGYESIRPGEGIMEWFAPGGREELAGRFASGQAVTARPVRWSDYATLNAMSCSPVGPPQRSRALRIVGQGIVEQSFLELLSRIDNGKPIQAMVLATASGWPVGWAIAGEDSAGEWSPGGPGDRPTLLDVYVHPNFAEHYGRLLAAVQLPAGKVIAMIDSVDLARESALRAAGFDEEGRLTGVYKWNGTMIDTIFMAKGPK